MITPEEIRRITKEIGEMLPSNYVPQDVSDAQIQFANERGFASATKNIRGRYREER